MKKLSIFLAMLLLLLSIACSILNITYGRVGEVLRVTLEIFSILFSSSSAFMFSLHLTRNDISNKNNDSFNGNNVEGDLIVDQSTSIFQNIESEKELVPALNRLADVIEFKHKENVKNIQKDIEEKIHFITLPIKQPNEDFMYRYVDNGRTISDKDIQKIWADLYIKEATNPSSVSFRTLEIVKNLTFSEMVLFLKVLEYCIKVGESGYIPNEICKDVFSLLDITRLGDIGLLKSETSLSWTPSFVTNTSSSLIIGDLFLVISNKTSKEIKTNIPVYVLTDAGVQLGSAINCWIKSERAIEFAKYLKNKYNGLGLSLHKIISMSRDGDINYDPNDIL